MIGTHHLLLLITQSSQPRTKPHYQVKEEKVKSYHSSQNHIHRQVKCSQY